jgi:DNA-binding NtrC family response regulator
MSQIQPLKDVRKKHVQDVLRLTGGDLDKASRVLGISEEQLIRLLRQNNIPLPGLADQAFPPPTPDKE